MAGQQAVYGVIDRLIKTEDSILIIDYKSHQLAEGETLQEAAQQFSAQLTYYRNGVEKLWPGHAIKTGVLFTYHKKVIWLD
jgi:ATP-dependent helicase/nuclease subunit A